MFSFSGQKFTFMLSQNDSGRFGVDDRGNLYKASNETNYETDKSHQITVVVTDNGNPPLNVRISRFVLNERLVGLILCRIASTYTLALANSPCCIYSTVLQNICADHRKYTNNIIPKSDQLSLKIC